MARTPSTMVELGVTAPDFRLPDFDGKVYSRDDFGGSKALLVVFICNHCPFVKHVSRGLAELGRDLQKKNVAMVGINPNDFHTYPDDSPAGMKEETARAGYEFPYLVDESQETARAYRAACTPDFFLFDQDLKLVYRGQMDGSRPDNDVPVTGRDIRAAVENLLAGKAVEPDQVPSMGCNIKWKKGNEPDYFG